MKDTFNLKTYLIENKLTPNSVKALDEISAELLKRAQNTPAPKATQSRRPEKGLRASMGENAEQEQKVIDYAKDAIALMDEQPGTSAEDALEAVLDV